MRSLNPFLLFLVFWALTSLGSKSTQASVQASGAQASQNPTSNTCGTMQSPVTWKYCITRSENSQDSDVLYFFHGGGDDETLWFSDTDLGAIQQNWSSAGVRAPTVITISFGPVWLLTKKNSRPASGLTELVGQYIIPFIEKTFLHEKVARRSLFGLSMGGFNAAQLHLQFPELFERTVMACPALSVLSPYATEDEIVAFIKRTGAKEKVVRNNIAMARNFFPDTASWQNDSPIEMAAKLLGKNSPPLHISCGDKDQAGFYEGSLLFAEMAAKIQSSVIWQSLSGGHCTLDPESIAKFLRPIKK